MSNQSFCAKKCFTEVTVTLTEVPLYSLLCQPSIYPSVFCHISKAGSCKGGKQGSADVTLPSNVFQLLLGDPGVAYWLVIPEETPGKSRRPGGILSKTIQLAIFNVKEQWLYSLPICELHVLSLRVSLSTL